MSDNTFSSTLSQVVDENGLMLMRHNSNMRYFMVFPKTKGDYTEYINYDESIKKLFTFWEIMKI